jgi:hypothetical protein
MQETFGTAQLLLPPASVLELARRSLRATACALLRIVSAEDGVKSFNLYAIQRLAHNVAAVARFATRCEGSFCSRTGWALGMFFEI